VYGTGLWLGAFAAGIVCVAFWPALPAPRYIPVLVVAGLALALPRVAPCRCASGLLLGASLALWHGHALLASRLAADCVGVPVVVSGSIASLVAADTLPDGTLRRRLTLAVRAIAPGRCAGPRRIDLTVYGAAAVHPGEQWRFAAKLKRPWGHANPGGWNRQGWFARRGIDAVGHVPRRGMRQRLADSGRVADYHRLRQAIAARIETLGLAPDVAGVLRAVTVADKGGVGAALWSTFQHFGINHLLVVSGLHVGLVAGCGLLIGRAGARLIGRGGGWLPQLAALAPAAGYAALAGFSLPVQRALCMLAAFTVASWAGRRGIPARNLLLAAAVVLAINPLAPTGSGFWLSFGAVAALLWQAAWQARGRGGGGTVVADGGARLRRAVVTQGYMCVVMLPVGAWFFGGGSLVSLPANLLMIPLVGCVVVPLALAAAALFLAGVAGADVLWYLAARPLELLLPAGERLAASGPPGMFLRLGAPPAAFALALLGVALLVLPGRGGQRALPLLLMLPLLLGPLRQPAGDAALTRVTVLDVGQGTAVVIRAGGRALLYDTGGGFPGGPNAARATVLPFLRQQGIAALDTLIISHGDLDHSAGAGDILERLPVRRIRRGDASSAAATGGGTAGRPCLAGESWRWPGGQRFRFLSPAREAGLSSNNRSCVLLVEAGDYRLLLAGDIEKDRERTLVRFWGPELAAEWLLAPHHGSATSSSRTLLKTVGADTAVISAAYANRFGHPHPDVLGRLRAAGAAPESTANGGALTFEIGAGGVRLVRYRQALRRYWL